MTSRATMRTTAWVLAIALAAATPYALKKAADHDLWWHVRTGQMILEQGHLPDVDPFSFTASGAGWTNHEWLSDVVLACVFALGGDRALSVWRVLLFVAVLVALAALLWRRLPHPTLVLAAVLLGTPLIHLFINLRPHTYTYLFALLLLLLVESAPRRPALLWGIPPLLVLWTNLHGGFLLGGGILGVCALGRWLGLGADGTRPDAAERRVWCFVLPLCLAAPLLNPYGAGLFSYLARELGADHSLILEWRGIWSFPAFRWQFLTLCAVPLVALALARRLRPAAPVALFALSVAATWVHARFLILLVLFATLVTFSALSVLLEERYPRIGRGPVLDALRAPRWAVSVCLVTLLAGSAQLAVDLRQKGLRLAIDRRLPVQACEFLLQHDLGPNLLLRLDWGGYAIWHLYPRYRVAADGRNLTVYDAGFVDGLLRAYDDGRFAELARQTGADVILSESAGPTYRELLEHGEWVPVHRDLVAAVFVRPEVARSLDRPEVERATSRPAADRFFFP